MNYDDFENEIYGDRNKVYTKEGYLTYDQLEALAGTKVRGSLLWMVLGLIITGVVAYVSLGFVVKNPVLLYVALGLELVTVLAFSALTYKASAGILKIMFLLYSFLNGVTFSTLLIAYDSFSLIAAFMGTLILFTVLAIYGYVTKEDLSKYGAILRAGLIAMIVMGLVNIFLRSSSLMWIGSMLGVGIFIIFIAYDVNRIKQNVIEYAITEDASIIDKIEIHGALSLYLDFINLFIYILRLVGKRND